MNHPLSTYRRALVTGANGFIGTALVRQLLAEGIAVRAIVRDPSRAQRLSGAEIAIGDVQDAATMRRHVSGCDLVFHVAAVGAGSAAVQYQINVRGAEHVARAAADSGAARLIHVSSVAVYGTALDGQISETQPMAPSPRDFYQQSKALGERAVWRIAQQSGLATTVIRPAFVYGPHSTVWTAALYALCRRAPLVPQLPGLAHPIFMRDLVDLLRTAATHPQAPGEVFHASADPAVPWPEFLGYYAAMTGNGARLDVSPRMLAGLAAAVRPVESLLRWRGAPADLRGMLHYVGRRVTYRMDKARDLLGWQPRTSLPVGMAECQAWLLSPK